MRVCLVGELSVGKTTICYDMINKKDFTHPTIGLDFYAVQYKNHKINLWDTAGQERYRSLLPMYIKKANVILYVISARYLKEEDYVYWKNYIDLNSTSNYKIIIIVTKCDINRNYKNELVYLKNFFPNHTILFRFNNNISNKILDEIIKYNIQEEIPTEILDLKQESKYDFNKKIKCCA